ncbi:hypothetical protein LTR27_005311 [Elasticomyces elasticus]|nr:hypothetical protein LTR27_005311 [Elasticomyces elasticus]
MAPAPPNTSVDRHLSDLQSDLFDIRMYNYDGRHFIPKTTFSELLTDEAVERYLTPDTTDLLDTVCNSARKIFAILTLSSNTLRHFYSTLQELMELGFTDAHLPIEIREEQGPYFAQTIVAGDPDRLQKCFGPTFRNWTKKERQDFCDAQWHFLAPVFSSELKNFVHHLDCRQPLPFIKLDKKVSGDGHFAEWCDADNTSHLPIAVKEYKITAGTDVAKRAWEVEARVCEQMPRHKHIVERIAAVAQNDRYYLLLAWADGGTLKSFWQSNPGPAVTGKQIMEILEQFLGLALATLDMHTNKEMSKAIEIVTAAAGAHSIPTMNTPKVTLGNGEPAPAASSHWRHGDLKSDNILRFTNDESWLGTLKIADLGLAKSHTVNTKHRQAETSTEHATTQYEAPEARTHPLAPRSRLYDIWSIGCILLETVIWSLHGFEQLDQFWTTDVTTSKATLFYTTTDSATGLVAEVSEVASSWMKRILEDDPECNGPEGSALGDLLRLVQQKLLVVAIPDGPGHALLDRRIDAAALCDSLRDIISKAAANPKYLSTGTDRSNISTPGKSTHPRQSASSSSGDRLAPAMANKRPRLDVPRHDGQETKGISFQVARHQQLDQNEWSTYPDEQAARAFLRVLEQNGMSEPPPHSAVLCERCKAFDFQATERIEDTLSALESRSSQCGLCELILKALASRSYVDGTHSSFVLRMVKSGLVIGEGKARKRILDACKWPVVEASGASPYVRLGPPRRMRSDDPAHQVILRQWLEECDLHHPQCLPVPGRSSLALAQRPTRVIDLGTQDAYHLHLVETGGLPAQTGDESRYVALSYAWGDKSHRRFLATPANYDELKRGIVYTDLPKTFQDAINVTKELGIRYLWIDGLCILQGPEGDFDIEAERMEAVFSNAYCVIAASRATGTSDGFLGTRNEHQVVSIPQLGGAHVYVYEPIDDFQQDVIDGGLNKRGWVLQERVLARRTIFFTGRQTYWQCGHGVRCETMTRLENKEAAFLGDPNFPKVAEDGSKGAQIHLYELLYRTYSTLAFMNAVDRPVGIAGLESRLIRAFGTDGGYGIFEKYLHRGIMWQRASSDVQRISFSRAVDQVPSWSWMAYQGPIKFVDIPFKSVYWEIEEIQSPWTAEPAPTGSRHSTRRRSGACLVVIPRIFKSPVSATSDECLVFDDGTVDPGPQTRCVVVGRQRHYAGSSAARRHYVLLVRQRPRPDLYERVGVGWLPGSAITFDGPEQLVQVS